MERAIETKKLVMTYGKGQGQVEALKGIVTFPTDGQLILAGDNIYDGSKRDFQ